MPSSAPGWPGACSRRCWPAAASPWTSTSAATTRARAGAERGRSINLAISARGLDALGRVGLDERTLDDALPMRGRTLHSPTGALAYQSYSADGTRAINSISRAGLNHALLDRAEETPGVRLHFGRRLVGRRRRDGRADLR